MHSQVMKITPALAESWLMSNTFNRSLSSAVVNKYANDMKSGNWHLNHQGIAFDDCNVLVDGQHRLSAVVKSGVTVDMLVTYGASRVGVDELRVRSSYDVIKFGSLSEWVERDDVQIAKAIPVIFDGARSNLSTHETLKIAEKYKEGILFCKREFKSNKKGIQSALVRSCFAVAFYHFDEQKLSDMIKSLYSGIITSADDAVVIRAREMILSADFSGATFRYRSAKRLCRAIEAYCNGEKITQLREPAEMPFLPPI